MLRYLLSRLLQLVPVLALVAVTVFILSHVAAGDPAAVFLGQDATTEEVEALRESLGLNAPLYVQFLDWAGGLLTGDLGWSLFLQQSVSEALAARIVPTAALSVFALILALLVAVPIGVAAARNRGGALDSLLTGTTLIGLSIPSFVLALVLALVFGVMLRWLPIAGYKDPSQGLGQFIVYLILPAISLAAMISALIARMTRATMIANLQSSFINTARAKGASPMRVLVNHAFRTSVNPILEVVAQSFGLLVTGAVVVEVIFNIPGIGQLLIAAVQRRDYEVIQGVVVAVAAFYVLLNFAVDLLYGVFDPRVRVKA